MIHIVYAFIYKYRCLENIGISFDSGYACSFDVNQKCLTISSQSVLPKSFWDKAGKVHSVSAIVGDNGAGKSTVLCFLLDALVAGHNRDNLNGIIVYEQNNRYLIYGKGIQIVSDKEYVIEHHLKSINTFYYSGHFLPYVAYDDLRTVEFEGSYIASDIYQLSKGVLEEEKNDGISNGEYREQLLSYILQNNYRICMLLADKELRSHMTYDLPRYIKVEVDTSGHSAIFQSEDPRYKEYRHSIPYSLDYPVKDAKLGFLINWVFNVLLNMMTSGSEYINPDDYITIIKDWEQCLQSTSDVIGVLEQCIEKPSIDPKTKAMTMVVLGDIKEMYGLLNCEIDSQGVPCFFLSVMNDIEKIERLAELERKASFTAWAQVCVFKYSQELGSRDSILSSGEMEMLNMLSRLYDAIVLQPSRLERKPTPLILLDEAETGFHPEWQRRYLQLVLEFLSAMPVTEKMHYQIVITTHSPILLSDLPSACVNFLKREGGKTVRKLDEEETFGENVFNLYRRAFFMEKGLIGEFARNKMSQVKQDIDAGEVSRDTRKTISIIGDDRIREYFQKRIARQDIDSEISYYEEKINELKKRRNKDE